ncbi:hypothetical protein PYW07_010628 [Mythimna separata]|uniref:Hyaluronidase n=1 Tax=Mythimna separata TaxID=271217 RepID=A0AAD7YAK1_MYTSE|nr:hypothetical protein PYW07_010628 [Mythimna separata]
MKTFLFILLAGYAVRCDDSNYFVVQMPENDVLPTKDFKVYWNVPTKQCKSKKVFFNELYEKYGIIQNTGDTFRGDKISILYDPGDFPALLTNSSSGEIKYRNGGVPQEGDLIKHLDTFQKVLEQSVPDKNFNGVGIIDFESWRPVLRQNFGTLTPYKDVSYEIEKKRHWWWKKQWIEEEAKRRFEGASREFMQATVSLAKKMRPRAVWGYYGFPYCFNKKEACADKVPHENDGIGWLWQESTALYPSVYCTDDITANKLVSHIRGRVNEAARVGKRGAPILPYFWFRYRDNGYFSEKDLDIAFSTLYKSNASGFIIWGSSNDVNTLDKCLKLKEYVTETLGPAIAKYTKPNMRLGDEVDETFTENNQNNASKIDPEFIWIPPVNYTQMVEEMVDKELKEEKEAAATHKKINESILVDMILHKIANYCADGCDNKVKKTDENEGNGGTNESRVVLVTEDPFKKNPSEIAVTVPTTTEDDIDDYESESVGKTEDATVKAVFESNVYIDISTTSKNIETTSTTMKTIDEINTTTSKGDEIIIIETSKDESGTFKIGEEQNGTVDVSKEESSTIAIATIEPVENSYNDHIIIIEDINTIGLSSEDTNSTEESTTEISTTTLGTTEPSINDLSTTESTTNLSPERISTIKDGLTIIENSTESNSILRDFIIASTEDSSTDSQNAVDDIFSNSATVIPIDVDYGIVEEPSDVYYDITDEPNEIYNGTTSEPSEGDNDTTDELSAVTKSAISTTLAPVLTEQVLGSVSRALVSKPLACSLFYLFSISRCICALLGNC